MATIWSEQDRQRLLARVDRLTPASVPVWGRMNVEQMLAHCHAQLRMSLGELPCEEKQTPLRRAPLKQLVIYLLPWPKGLPTAPQLRQAPTGAFEAERSALRAKIVSAGLCQHQPTWPLHPAFGRLSPRAWGVLMARHLDHHLRQFGV